jgi:hypothetical protein
VTHCFHPWFGREFEFVVHRQTWGEDRVYFYLGDGAEIGQLPAAWTDAVAPDVFVAVAAGRCEFRIADLLAAADLVTTVRPEVDPAGSGVKETSP